MTEPRRTLNQNAKLRAMCDDLSRCKPEGREHDPESWKVLMFAGWDYDRRFGDLQLMAGLEGRPPVPLNGYHTSLLTVGEMNELIAFTDAYGARHGVKWGGGDHVAAEDPLLGSTCKHGVQMNGLHCGWCKTGTRPQPAASPKPLPGHAFRIPRDPLLRHG